MNQPPIPSDQAVPKTTAIHKRAVGRPPSSAARQAILETAYRILMDEGLGRLTIERVASQAGVGKPTIYRSWSNAQELAMAAFMARPDTAPAMPRQSSARASIQSHLAGVISAFASHRGRQITLTMASADQESELAKAFRNQIILKNRELGRGFIQLGVLSGELAVSTNIETVLDMLYGPIFFRLLAGHLPLNSEFSSQLVDTIFDGLVAPPKGRPSY
jgi:AcrR family transcriptional regulator